MRVEGLPNDGDDPKQVIEHLAHLADRTVVATAGPRYFGFVVGGSLPVTVAADWLTSVWDQNAAFYAHSPLAAAAEQISAEWLIQLFGLANGTSAGFVSGGTMANFTGLAAGRHALLAKLGWDVERQGLFGAPEITVVTSDESHVSVFASLQMLGLGSERVVRVPADGQGRIDPSALPALSGPALVCLQAGNVNSGASDPFVPLIAWAREHGAWVHVDGAFGLWAAASAATARQVAGAGEADSWATDAHKWLNTSYDCGIALVRDRGALRSAMEASAAYLPGDADTEPMNLTPQSSQRARDVEVWAALAFLGRDGMAELVDRTCRLARRFADAMARALAALKTERVHTAELERRAQIVMVTSGLEAEGKSTTVAVVAGSVAVIAADFFVTQILVRMLY
jgi:glutamate/tyrosine decarboxylase-like PLP-dependent enzyme